MERTEIYSPTFLSKERGNLFDKVLFLHEMLPEMILEEIGINLTNRRESANGRIHFPQTNIVGES